MPGSQAAAPTPMTTRAATRTVVDGARAPTIDAPANTANPASITLRRPSLSPSMPMPSMSAAKVKA